MRSHNGGSWQVQNSNKQHTRAESLVLNSWSRIPFSPENLSFCSWSLQWIGWNPCITEGNLLHPASTGFTCSSHLHYSFAATSGLVFNPDHRHHSLASAETPTFASRCGDAVSVDLSFPICSLGSGPCRVLQAASLWSRNSGPGWGWGARGSEPWCRETMVPGLSILTDVGWTLLHFEAFCSPSPWVISGQGKVTSEPDGGWWHVPELFIWFPALSRRQFQHRWEQTQPSWVAAPST